jgi:hypothetical protein
MRHGFEHFKRHCLATTKRPELIAQAFFTALQFSHDKSHTV